MTEKKESPINFLYSWQLRHTQVTKKLMNSITIEKFLARLFKERYAIVNTFAYKKMDDGRYFITKSNLHDQDENCKKEARRFALMKFNRIYAAAMASKDENGNIRMPSEKTIQKAYEKDIKVIQFKIMTSEELDKLKRAIEENNVNVLIIKKCEMSVKRFQWDVPKEKPIKKKK